MRNNERKSKRNFIDVMKEHVYNNKRQYFIVSIIFLIGVIIGVIFVNNVENSNMEQIQNYLNTFVNSLKGEYQIDQFALLKNSIINNLILAISIWFIGSTVVGIPIMYILIGIKGFSLGYTISSALITFGTWKGILFNITTLLLQNIILIPCILALGVSGMKLYKSIIKDKRRENIKIEILRHTIFSIFIAIIMVISSIVEVYISSNIFSYIVKYI